MKPYMMPEVYVRFRMRRVYPERERPPYPGDDWCTCDRCETAQGASLQRLFDSFNTHPQPRLCEGCHRFMLVGESACTLCGSDG